MMTEPAAVDPRAVAVALERYVRPGSYALAIRVFAAGEALPEKLRRPRRDLGIQVSICQGLSMARRYGWAVGLGAEDVNCPIAQVAFGFEEALPYYDEGNLAAGMYVAACQQGALTEASIPRLAPEQAGVVVAAPLGRCDFEPQTLLCYANGAQVALLSAASLWRTGGTITSTTSLRADCADIVIRPLQTGLPQFILPCMGDRIFGHTQDDEMAFTSPWSLLPGLLEGLEGTYKGGIRYPIPQFLRYTPRWPESYEKLHELWRGEE
ncbi:MAG: DUF169 domain-containing protein [Chloroflexota bacterium]